MGSFPEMYNDPISFGAGEANLFNNQDIFFFLVIICYILITFTCGLAVIYLGENGC